MITQKELDIMLNDHQLWIDSDFKRGKRADFSERDVSGLVFSGHYLYMVKFVNANCEGTKFRRSNLIMTDFTNANCKEANFEVAGFWGATGNDKQLKSLSIGCYTIVYTKDILQIGCKQYTFEEWLSFSDSKIDAMDRGFLEWWIKFKEPLFKIIEQDPAED